MHNSHKINKLNFFLRWTIISTGVIPLSYILGLIPMVLIHGAFGYSMSQWGTPFTNTLTHIVSAAVMGLGCGLYQQLLLKKLFPVRISWTRNLMLALVLGELIIGLMLLSTDVLRGELRFIELNALPESAIFGFLGFMVGLFQFPLLRKHFSRSWTWVPASTIGFGMMPFVIYLSSFITGNESMILLFFVGVMIYGILTGATLLWVMKPKVGMEKEQQGMPENQPQA